MPFQNFFTVFHAAKVDQSWAFQKLTLSKVASFKGLNRKEKKKNQTVLKMVSFTRRHFQKLDLYKVLSFVIFKEFSTLDFSILQWSFVSERHSIDKEVDWYHVMLFFPHISAARASSGLEWHFWNVQGSFLFP